MLNNLKSILLVAVYLMVPYYLLYIQYSEQSSLEEGSYQEFITLHNPRPEKS